MSLFSFSQFSVESVQIINCLVHQLQTKLSSVISSSTEDNGVIIQHCHYSNVSTKEDKGNDGKELKLQQVTEMEGEGNLGWNQAQSEDNFTSGPNECTWCNINRDTTHQHLVGRRSWRLFYSGKSAFRLIKRFFF